MVMVAQRHEIGQIGRSFISPMHDVVDIGEGVVGATGEPAPSIAPLDFMTLGVGGESLGPTLEHRVAEGIIERQGDGRIATNASDGLTTQEAHPFDLGPTSAALQERKVCMGDHEEGRSGSGRRLPGIATAGTSDAAAIPAVVRPGAVTVQSRSVTSTATACLAEVDESIGQALVIAGLAIGWEGASSISDRWRAPVRTHPRSAAR